MRTKQTFVYGILAVIFALSLTGCDNGNGGKDDPTVTWPAGLTAVHGQTLSAVSLAMYTNGGGTAGAFSWVTPSDSVGNYGTRSHNMIFTPTDTSKYDTAKKGVDVLVSSVAIVRVAGGSFTMGSPTTETDRETNETQWTVTLSPFYMSKHEVTQKEYETVMGSLPSDMTDNTYGKGDNYPIYYVSWYDALVFCNKLSVKEGLTPAYSISGKTDPAEWGAVPTSSDATWNAVVVVSGSNGYRLPTEAQWEYAARGGPSASGYKIYSGSNTVDDVAWYSGNNGASGTPTYGTKQVGTKAANELGIHDMSGNVFEWCWDWYDTYPTTAQTDPVGASSGSYRVGRGGSWNASAQNARSALRGDGNPDIRYNNLGFRVLRP